MCAAWSPLGLDGHTHDPTPSDARTFADAGLVFLPGADLDPRLAELAQANVPDDGVIVDLNALTLKDDQLLLGSIEVPLSGDQGCIDVHLAHVIDDDGDSSALSVGKDVVEQRGLARAQETGEDGYRQK